MNIYIIRNVIYKISYLENKSNTVRYLHLHILLFANMSLC